MGGGGWSFASSPKWKFGAMPPEKKCHLILPCPHPNHNSGLALCKTKMSGPLLKNGYEFGDQERRGLTHIQGSAHLHACQPMTSACYTFGWLSGSLFASEWLGLAYPPNPEPSLPSPSQPPSLSAGNQACSQPLFCSEVLVSLPHSHWLLSVFMLHPYLLHLATSNMIRSKYKINVAIWP